MTVADASQAKAGWRARLLARRDVRDPSQIRSAGMAIAAHGVALCGQAGTVAAYLAVAGEPPTGPLIAALRAAGAGILLPVVDGDRLDWAFDTGQCRSGPFGIPEPAGERLGAGALASAAMVFVPALAVDRRGVRLGRGRGYYDRALAAWRTGSTGVASGLAVAIVYDDEYVDALPAEAHDARMDGVLTPSGWHRPGR